jgi:hypothetical protein
MHPTSNQPCPCGSGKKYKRCHRDYDDAVIAFREKVKTGALNVFARVVSTDGTNAQMEIAEMSVTQDGHTTLLVDEHMTLSTNAQSGDKTSRASASISFPSHGLSNGIIRTSGNASVSNNRRPIALQISGTSRSLKKKSENGLFVVARIKVQRDAGREYFDILFGTANRRELRNELGEKQRPHLAFHPDGNGKFIRLSGYKCELETEQKYISTEKTILPSTVRIQSLDHMETVELLFESVASDFVNLKDIRFLSSK